jgi:hypothetical protein
LGKVQFGKVWDAHAQKIIWSGIIIKPHHFKQLSFCVAGINENKKLKILILQ